MMILGLSRSGSHQAKKFFDRYSSISQFVLLVDLVLGTPSALLRLSGSSAAAASKAPSIELFRSTAGKIGNGC